MKLRSPPKVAGLFAAWAVFSAAPPLFADNTAQDASIEQAIRGFKAIRTWQVDEARRIAAALHQDRPEDPLTVALVADVKMHLGDYPGAVTLFHQAQQMGVPEQFLLNARMAEAARTATQGYDESISEHFVIRHTAGRDKVLVPYAAETLEKAREKIGTLLGFKPKARVILEIYPSAQTLAAVSTLTKSEIENSGTIALCRWNRLMITSPRAVVFGYSWRDTLSHELAHLIIGGASKNTVPIWLHEGVAKYVETAWRDEPGLGISEAQQKALKKAAKEDRLIPFEKMHPSMAKLKSQEETSLAFSEVFTFIEFLVKRKGWEGMRQVFRLMADGKSDSEAIAAVHGMSLKKLSKKWMATLKTRPIKVPKSNAPVKGERKLVIKDRPETPDDQLHGLSKKGRRFARAADLLYARGRIKAAQRELEKAYAETKSPLISGKLAMVALATGDLSAAETAARAAILGTPHMSGPNVTLAEVLVRQGKTEDAQEPLNQAIGINPFDPRIHGLLLAIADAQKNQDKQIQAQVALALLGGEGGRGIRPLGQGGMIQIHGAPFHRAFIVHQNGFRIATGMVTPTNPIAIKPGTYELELVPPSGPGVKKTIKVMEKPEDGTPQQIMNGPNGT